MYMCVCYVLMFLQQLQVFQTWDDSWDVASIIWSLGYAPKKFDGKIDCEWLILGIFHDQGRSGAY